MKKLILLSLFASNALFANEFQSLSGEEAYKQYLSLKGVRCVEWNSKDFIVYTKYETNSCDESAPNTNWTCTIQISKLNSNEKYMSADCSREIP